MTALPGFHRAESVGARRNRSAGGTRPTARPETHPPSPRNMIAMPMGTGRGARQAVRTAHAGSQRIRFSVTPDGARIAFATSGTGPPLVKVSNWLTHLEFDWQSPVWRHWLRELGRDHTLVRSHRNRMRAQSA